MVGIAHSQPKEWTGKLNVEKYNVISIGQASDTYSKTSMTGFALRYKDHSSFCNLYNGKGIVTLIRPRGYIATQRSF